MATSFIDLEAVIGMIQSALLGNAALTDRLDIQQEHEPDGDGVEKPSVHIVGLDNIEWEGRSTGAADKGSDTASATLQLAVLHDLDTFTKNRYRAWGAASLLTKTLCEAAAIIDTGGGGAPFTGHIIHLGGGRTKCRIRNQNFGDESMAMRGLLVEIPAWITRVGSALAIEGA